jgi:hypothetical protein
METRRDKYGLNLEGVTDQELAEQIVTQEENLVKTETFLEILWEEVNRRNVQP